METQEVLFALLRNAVCGQPVSVDIKDTLANYHDLAHLVGRALEKLELPECERLAKCRNISYYANIPLPKS